MRDLKRKLNYEFYSLSLNKQLKILVNMGLIKDDYETMSIFNMLRNIIKETMNNDNLFRILQYLVDLEKDK